LQENPTTESSGQEQAVNSIKELGQIEIPSFKSDVHCLTITGQVEGHMVLPPPEQNHQI
jgi:hypothetical protein